MTRRAEIDAPGQAAPISHYAHAVRADGPLLFVSGVVPVDERGGLVGGGDVVEQARAVFRNLGEGLADGGATVDNIIKVKVFLTDVDDRPLINPIRQEAFGAARPASTLVEVSRLAVPGARIEVEAVAVVC